MNIDLMMLRTNMNAAVNNIEPSTKDMDRRYTGSAIKLNKKGKNCFIRNARIRASKHFKIMLSTWYNSCRYDRSGIYRKILIQTK